MILNRFQRPQFLPGAAHSVVLRDEKAFSSHPFVGGLWRISANELLAGFTQAACDYRSEGDVHHNNIATTLRRVVTIRSRDNGASWDGDDLVSLFEMNAGDEAHAAGYENEPPVDFLQPGVIVAAGSTPAVMVAGAKSWLRLSENGGRSWRAPILLPAAGLPSLSAHGAAVTVRADGMLLLGLNSVSADGWTRRPLIYASRDGRRFDFLSFVTPFPDDGGGESTRENHPRFGAHRYFYPRPLSLRDGRILLSMRCQRDPTSVLWTEIFASEDGGRTWRFLSRVNDWGAPGDIVEMADGRIACVYGYRMPPYGVRARMSEDGGAHWGSEWILRDDGGSWDLGYPRVIEHGDGMLLTIYYMNRADDRVQINGGVRHIAQTIFSPP